MSRRKYTIDGTDPVPLGGRIIDFGRDIAAILRPHPKQYLDEALVLPWYQGMSTDMQEMLGFVPAIRDTPANRQLMAVFARYQTVREFFATTQFYPAFRARCQELGLAENFDGLTDPLYFRVARERRVFASPGGIASSLLRECDLLVPPALTKSFNGPRLEEALALDLGRVKAKLIAQAPGSDEFFAKLQEYFNLLFTVARCRYPEVADQIRHAVGEMDFLGALGKLNEFYRDKLGNEIINVEPDETLKTCLGIVLDQEITRLDAEFAKVDLAQTAKREADDSVEFSLVLDPRNADGVGRGVISSDCTDVRRDFAFHETIPQHLLDPGFLNFRLYRDTAWVGNVYTLVMEQQGVPMLVIDALQTSETYLFPCATVAIAEQMIEQMRVYARKVGFKKMALSRFLSNRGLTQYFLNPKYPLSQQVVTKVGGFDHLHELGLWDTTIFRNEYLETLMPGNPNLVTQALPLRMVTL